MKRHLTILLVALTTFNISAQTQSAITGTWNGDLKIQGTQLRMVFHIETSNDVYSATMDSPDQKAFGIPTSSVTFADSILTITVANIGMKFSGKLSNDEVVGQFRQSGMELPLTLTRKPIEKVETKRPQEPTKPYPYYTEEITFNNTSANITLAGTLTLPSENGKFPVVIFISGSGPQDRNEEVMGHKPFLVFADYLARHGIGSLRFDDRGTAQSGGEFNDATSADFATDVESAIAFLKGRNEIDYKMIGLIGHSEGGIIAPMVASNSTDVDFIVLLAGPGIKGDKLLLLQQELILRASGITEEEINKSKAANSKLFEMITSSTNDHELEANLANMIRAMVTTDTSITIPQGMSREEYIELNIKQVCNPWMLYFLRYDPTKALNNTKCAVLAVNGEKDLQVPANANLPAIKSALNKGGNNRVTTKSFANLNHLFQECNTGHPNEYTSIEQTISPVVLEFVTQWINEQTK